MATQYSLSWANIDVVDARAGEEVVLIDDVPAGRQGVGDGKKFRGFFRNEGISVSERNRKGSKFKEGGQGIGRYHRNVEEEDGIIAIEQESGLELVEIEG